MTRDNSRTASTILVILGGISLALLLFRLTERVATFRAVVSYLLHPMPYYSSQVFDRFANLPAEAAQLISLDIQLREAKQELKEAAFLRSEVKSLRRENDRLLGELGMDVQAIRVVRWARVLKRDPMNWNRSITVAAGTEDGIEVNAPVLGLIHNRFGVVGRVIEAGSRISKVLLLSDDLSAVAANFPEKSWEGLIQGQGSSRLRMNYLPLEAKLAIGDPVTTSPTSATFGPGLLIGTVTRIFEKDPFLAFQSVEVMPAVPAGALKEVMILMPKSGAL